MQVFTQQKGRARIPVLHLLLEIARVGRKKITSHLVFVASHRFPHEGTVGDH